MSFSKKTLHAQSLFGQRVHKLFERHFMDLQQREQTLERNIASALLHAPVLHARKLVIIGEGLVAGVAFFLAQFYQFFTNL